MKQGTRIGIAVAGVCISVAVILLLLRPEQKDAALPTPGSAPCIKDRASLTAPAMTDPVTASAAPAERKGLPSVPLAAPSVAAASAGPAGKHGARMTRPEDAGEDFSLLESSEVIRRLAQSTDRVEQRKAAKVLGDRDLAGKMSLSQSERHVLDGYAEKQVSLAAAEAGEERAEANDQIRRLWRLAADRLIDGLGSKNRTVVEAAIKNLALMRDEAVVGKIIGRLGASDDATFRRNAILALGMMRERRECLVPDRHTLGDDESENLAQKAILPFLAKLREREKDPETLRIINMAFLFLKNPPDARLRPSARQQETLPLQR